MNAIVTSKPSKSTKASKAKSPFVATSTAPVGRDVLVPLNRLVIHADNARKTRNPEGIPELAASLEAQGQMQRLAVVEIEGGMFGVVAGGRRYHGFMHNCDTGKIAADHLVECRQYESTHAVALSLAENSGREEMHPADQMEAFKRLVDDGLTVAQVAGRFGVSPLTVEKRLKLARLSPRFLAMFRESAIDSDQLMALTLVDGHAEQEAAWDSLSVYSRSAYQLRNLLTQGEAKASSRIAQFVGLDIYEKAGGKLRRDLFSDGLDGTYMIDQPLLQSLAIAKLEKHADAIRAEGWGWVACSTDSDKVDFKSHGRVYSEQREPTPEEAPKFAALALATEAAAEAVNLHYDSDQDAADYDDKSEVLEAAYEVAEERETDAKAALVVWTPEQFAIAGAIVHLSYSGKIEVTRGLVRPADRKAAVVAMKEAGETVPMSMRGSAGRSEYSEKLMKDMTAHRSAALQAALVQNPHVALVSLVHRMAAPLFSERHYFGESPLKVSAQVLAEDVIGQSASEFSESPASTILGDAQTRWGDYLPGEPVAQFRFLLTQDTASLLELLAYCTARSVNVVAGRDREHDHSDAIAVALGLDMADWWTATPAKYLQSVSKAKAIEAVNEATGNDCTKEVSTMKKGEAVDYCAAKLEGTRWLPAPLKTMVAKA